MILDNVDEIEDSLKKQGIALGRVEENNKTQTPRWNKNKPTLSYEISLHNSEDKIIYYYNKRGKKLIRVAVGSTIIKLGSSPTFEMIARQVKKAIKVASNDPIKIAPREMRKALRGVEDEDTSKLERRLKLLTPSTEHQAYLVIDGKNFTTNNMEIDIFTNLETAKKKAVSVGAYGVVEI